MTNASIDPAKPIDFKHIEQISAVNVTLQTIVMDQSGSKLTANVILPAPEDMQVRLVSASALERLDEYRGNENKWFAWMGIFIGSTLGLLINVVTGGSLKAEGIVLLVVLVTMGGLTGWTAYQEKQKGDRVRAIMLNKDDKSKTV